MKFQSVSMHPKFDVEDFATRWQRARRAAIAPSALAPSDKWRKIQGTNSGPEYLPPPNSAADKLSELDPFIDLNETLMLELVPEHERDCVLRKVFDNSRTFALSSVRYFGLSWELQDFKEILPKLNNPCLRGAWESRQSAEVIRRTGCREVKNLGSFVCDYWREAFDGLVVGLGEHERFSRHGSVGHGDLQCVDIIFDDSTPKNQMNRWGQIPTHHLGVLRDIQNDFLAQMDMHVEFLGIAEGELFCRWSSQKHVSCGSTGKILWNYLTAAVEKKIPGLKLKDTSPLAILGNEQLS